MKKSSIKLITKVSQSDFMYQLQLSSRPKKKAKPIILDFKNQFDYLDFLFKVFSKRRIKRYNQKCETYIKYAAHAG